MFFVKILMLLYMYNPDYIAGNPISQPMQKIEWYGSPFLLFCAVGLLV